MNHLNRTYEPIEPIEPLEPNHYFFFTNFISIPLTESAM